jgi:UDP-N-acetylglucosamine--N-acetylmuramyl-(pentapeptide) pyrophosphoryl-undecaprenol N-acetylglucosamine transferase
MARAGAATVVSDSDLTGARLAEIVRAALDSPGSLAARASAARTLARPGAAAQIATMAEQLMPGGADEVR